MDVLPALSTLLRQMQLPHDWIAVILDRQGRTVARTLDPEQYVGQPGTPAFLQRIRNANEGWFPFVSREGIPVYIAFDRVEPVGWTMVIAIPRERAVCDRSIAPRASWFLPAARRWASRCCSRS